MSFTADLAAIDTVNIVSGFYEDFRETMQTVNRLEAVLFFATMVHGDESHLQAIVMPSSIANRVMEALSNDQLLQETDLINYIARTFRIMQINSVTPAPRIYHLNILTMFERLAVNGMQDKPEVLADLSKLEPGDLIMLQFDLKEEAYTTMVRIVPNALSVYEHTLVTVPTSYAVH